MELKTALGSVGAKLRNSVRQLRYPSTPFEKLLSTQVLMLAGDAMVAIALAGSLFFDISPHAAQGHVLLGLGLTFVPFVVIAPAIGPLLDSIAGMRRAMILISALGRVALCLLMAGDLKSLLLFPESFGLLVLSKVYGISKQSLVPDMVAGSSKGEEAFVHANSTLNFFGAVAGFLGSAVAVALWKLPGLGSAWVLRVDALNFALAAACAFRIPGRSFPAGKPKDIPRARVSRAKGQKEASMMTTDPMGTSVIKNFKSDDSHQIVKTGHDGQAEPEIRIAHKPLRNKIARQRMAMLFAAASAMAVLRMEIGFLEFLLIFTLRRQHYSLI
ncbi:MAG TPA: hypothetical protein VMU77_01140, partial [Acidimicrobiales bacterium]|nr:hypothetical protein [Acidimicrobiales bacterium]